MIFNSGGTTTIKSRFARKLTTPNTDMVMAVHKIPPGCTVNWVHLNYLAVGKTSIPIHNATEVSLYGYLISDPKPDHGYGDGIAAYDAMWDDRVPKDYTDSSSKSLSDNAHVAGHPDSMETDSNTMAVESGAAAGSGSDPQSGGDSNVNDILNLGFGPEQTFARVQRLDVSNGLITESNKFKPIDKYNGRLNKRYHIPSNRYAHYMIAFGAPEFEASDSFADGAWWDQAYGTDFAWTMLAYPEFTVPGMLMSGSDFEAWADFVKQNLETAHIEADTYKDLDDSDNNVEDFVVYVNSTLNYSRPRQGALHLSSQA